MRRAGATVVWFGPHVMRIETAAVVAVGGHSGAAYDALRDLARLAFSSQPLLRTLGP